MSLKRESSFRVTVAGRWLACLHPDGLLQRIALDEVHAVHFQSASHPSSIEWWIVEGAIADAYCEFPLGATGEADALEWLKQLPGFEIKGMNATDRAGFLCWSRNGARGDA